ncbi:MAG: pyridoxal-phosphate dependent enzyme [Acidimicrobiales bacterium]
MTAPDQTRPLSALACSGCGAAPAPADPFPFACPNAGTGDIDHILRRTIDTSRLTFPSASVGQEAIEPFIVYRTLLHSYYRAQAGGIFDDRFVDLIQGLDDAVARVDGRGFTTTPFARSALLSGALGFSADAGVWAKDETGNVAGSHKGRHLMGVMLHLLVSEELGLFDRARRPDLAIASCGNAALAAAVVAAAARWPLRVFVPVDADPVILKRLRALGAKVVVCPREEGVAGDPSLLKLQEELAAGALPFTCQGNLNGLAIEGGETLAYEVVSELATGAAPMPDHFVVQVGGGALASSCAQAFDEALAFGTISKLPRLHTVQTMGAFPLERAYRLVREQLPLEYRSNQIDATISDATRHRSSFMWPWESEPKSVAAGILDDETYDWAAVVSAMLRTGGEPVVVSEERLVEAHAIAKGAGLHADPTGTASLAGLLDLLDRGVVTTDERVIVLITGVER